MFEYYKSDREKFTHLFKSIVLILVKALKQVSNSGVSLFGCVISL